MSNHLVIAGACVRQHIESARRAGFEPLGIDLYADWDTCQVAPCLQAQCLDEIPEILDKHVREHWVLTGGLEHTFTRMGSDPLPDGFLGPDLKALHLTSNPHTINHLASAVRFDFPLTNSQAVCPAGDWIQKPKQSAGGLRIQRAQPGEPRRDGHYFQRWTPGTPLSGVFLSGALGTRLIGTTFQLLGQDLGQTKSPFAYAGSIGPVLLDPDLRNQIIEIGETIGTAFFMKGVWGVDFVFSNGTLHPLDINPRMTASCDILERSGQVSSITSLHANACHSFTDGCRTNPELKPPPAVTIAKAIAFSTSDRPLEITLDRHRQLLNLRGSKSPNPIADIPKPGTLIPPRGPICTLYETNASPSFRFGNDSQSGNPGLPLNAKKMLSRLKKRVSNLNIQMVRDDDE